MLDKTLPEVKRFAGAAFQHREGARTLYEQCDPSSKSRVATEAIYLGGYAVECVLKALILTRTPKRLHDDMVENLKKVIGHDLEAAKRLLHREKKVELPEAQRLFLARVRALWSSEMRYHPASNRTETVRDFLRAVEGIWSWAAGEVADAIN